MNLMDLVTPDVVQVPLSADDKEAAIDELVAVLDRAGQVPDPNELKRVVWERELQRSTGIGEGLAVPHGKTASIRSLIIALGVPAEPLDFDAIDGKPVRLVVLLASPPDRTAEHIQALSKISRMMFDEGFRQQAYGASSSEELYDLLKQAERAAAS